MGKVKAVKIGGVYVKRVANRIGVTNVLTRIVVNTIDGKHVVYTRRPGGVQCTCSFEDWYVWAAGSKIMAANSEK